MRKNDTIVAVATPPGTGGVAMVRISGPEALPLALKHCSTDALQPRRATYVIFLDSQGNFIDDGIALYFPDPHSYTGEPTVELSCHGSLYVQRALLDMLVADGARLAGPGEFTLRAFLNGKMGLSQAEAVADLIEAVSPVQHRLAVSQLRGGYAEKLRSLRSRLVELASLVELELDFSQEDVEFVDRHDLRRLVGTLLDESGALLDSFATGNALRQGVPVALVGEPNVGKSTLLNALLNDDRAIVSPIPGTTRDTVEAMLNINGITFRLIDTAGLRESSDEVERQGIMRSIKARDEATVVVEVYDSTLPVDYMSNTVHHDGKHYIRVINKCDLQPDAFSFDGRCLGDTLFLALSAKTGVGVDRLRDALGQSVDASAADESLLTNVRHREALLHMRHALEAVDEGLACRLPADLLAVDLRDALHHLGTVTGDVAPDDLLATIFSRFCIGK